MHDFNYILPVIEHFKVFAYFAVLIVSFLESLAFIGLIIPGTTFLVALGFLSSQGFSNPLYLILFSTLGAIAGDGLSYYLGKYSYKFLKSGSQFFKEDYIKKGENFIARHGNKSIVFGRFVGPLRPIVPFVAGMFKMEKKKFFFYNILSAVAWSVAYLALGYFFGEAWQAISSWSGRLAVLIFWVLFFLAVFYFLRWLLIKKGRKFIRFLASLFRSMGEGIKDDPNIKKFSATHPVFVNFLKGRTVKDKFSGMTLTVLVLIFIYAAWNFAGTVIDLVRSGDTLIVDYNFSNLLYAFRNPLPTRIFLWITFLGRWEIVVPVIIVFSVFFWIWGRKKYILPLVFSVSGSAVAGYFAKLLWHRPRPAGFIPVYLEKSWSFPSLHAVVAVSLYGFLIYFFWKHLKRWRNKINILFLGLLFILAIGFSRLYLGVHYLSDVWAGYMIGLMWLLPGIGLIEWDEFANSDTVPAPPLDENIPRRPVWMKTTTAVLLFSLIVFYIAFGLRFKPSFNIVSENTADYVIPAEKAADIFNDYKLPKFTETLTGNPQEPFSFIIVAGSDQKLFDTFKSAGWYEADNINFNSLGVALRSEIFNQPYPTAPITPYFWRTYTNDFGFEKPTQIQSVRYRHHARIWRTNFVTDSGEHVYAGISSLDMGIKWWGITHRIKPDLDTEREFLFADLKSTGEVAKYGSNQFVDPILGKNFTGDQFFTDGDIYTFYLK